MANVSQKKLMSAIDANDHEAIRQALKEGAVLNSIGKLKDELPIAYTITHSKLTLAEKIDTVKVLLELGASVDVASKEKVKDFGSYLSKYINKLPLEYAVAVRNKELVQLILDKKPLINEEYKFSLSHAIKIGNIEIAQMLLKHNNSIEFIDFLNCLQDGVYGTENSTQFFISSYKMDARKKAAFTVLKEYKDLVINNKVTTSLSNDDIIRVIDKIEANPTLIGKVTLLNSAMIIANGGDHIYVLPEVFKSDLVQKIWPGNGGGICWNPSPILKSHATVSKEPLNHLIIYTHNKKLTAKVDFSLIKDVHSVKDLDISEHKLGDAPYLTVNVKDSGDDVNLLMLYGISTSDLVSDVFVFAPESC